MSIGPFVVVGFARAVAYDLELLGGRPDNGAAFAVTWGVFAS